MSATAFEIRIFGALTDGADHARDLSATARAHEPASFARHVAALSMTKLADGLLSPKLILSWLLSTLGAATLFVGLLVPLRESLALLPQILIAPRIQAMARRKWVWAAGSVVQGAACAGIALAALVLSGNAAGVVVCALLSVLALARSVCSVSYRDVLGKTVGQGRRGAATGFAASFAAVGVIVFALVLVLWGAARMSLVLAALSLAAILWLAAGAIFATLAEDQTLSDRRRARWGQLRLLRDDPQLRIFIWVRGLLTATALAPPYLIVLEGTGGTFSRLGTLVLASSAASFLSSYVWGRLADRSSRRVLQLAGGAGAAALAAAPLLAALGQAGTWWAVPGVLFVLMIAYHGVRQGRSTYLVDMAPRDRTSEYTAVSNTAIGLVLLGSGLFGALASLAGAAVTLWLFAAMSAAAAIVAQRLDEVE